MSDRDFIAVDRDDLSLLPHKVIGMRSAYLDLLIDGPVRYRRGPYVALSRRWKIPTTRAVAIYTGLLNKGLIRTDERVISAVDFGQATPKALRPNQTSWRGLRQSVFERDNFTCVYCGSTNNLHADHIVARALGGLDEIENLATACQTCNLSKGAKPLNEWRAGH